MWSYSTISNSDEDSKTFLIIELHIDTFGVIWLELMEKRISIWVPNLHIISTSDEVWASHFKTETIQESRIKNPQAFGYNSAGWLRLLVYKTCKIICQWQRQTSIILSMWQVPSNITMHHPVFLISVLEWIYWGQAVDDYLILERSSSLIWH